MSSSGEECIVFEEEDLWEQGNQANKAVFFQKRNPEKTNQASSTGEEELMEE